MRTNAWNAIEKTSGKPWKELPDDYMVPVVASPRDNFIMVTGGGEEQSVFTGGRSATVDPAYSIDAWK